MQKEKLSALMDGELIDSELISSLSQDRELQQDWYRYHLIRDTLRGDNSQFVSVDIADNVFAAIEHDNVAPVELIPQNQPKPEIWQKMPFWNKVKPWVSQIGHAGLAAGISLAVIVGVQQYNSSGVVDAPTEIPAFNTFSIGTLASPVSYGAPAHAEQPGIQDHRRHIAILQDYELQRRLNAEPLSSKDVKKAEPDKKVEANN